jgi:hypothetical protein
MAAVRDQYLIVLSKLPVTTTFISLTKWIDLSKNRRAERTQRQNERPIAAPAVQRSDRLDCSLMLSDGDLLIGSKVPNFRQSVRASTQHLLSIGAPVDAQQRVRARLLRLGGSLALRANLIHGNLRAGRASSHHSTTNTNESAHGGKAERQKGASAVKGSASDHRLMPSGGSRCTHPK